MIFLQGHNKHQRRAVGLALLAADAERYNPIDIMKIICPSLGLEEEASAQSVAEIVPQLSDKKDPFVILEKDEMTYMQALWTPEGYDLEYQEGNVFEHYWLSELTTQDDVIWALQSYLKDEPYWKTKFHFEKKDIATPSHRIGYKIGAFWGRIFKNI